MIGSLKRLKDELYVRTTGKFVEGKTELDYLSNAAIVKIFERQAKEAVQRYGYPQLTSAQESEIREYYKDCPRFDTIYHRVYYGRTGRVEPEYMPEELYYGYIEPYMVDHEAARYIDNKTYYGFMFGDIKQPETIVMRTGSVWYGGGSPDVSASTALGNVGMSASTCGQLPIAKSEIPGLIKAADSELILKIAENSEEGAGVFFLSKEDPVADFKRVIRGIKNDVIVQRVVKQHPAYAALHQQSVNTLRIMSYLDTGSRGKPKVEILSTAVRIGTGGLRVDNVSAGGFFLGIDKDGRTTGLGAGSRGKVYRSHPELGYDLKGIELPGVDKAHELIKRAHLRFGKFRIISWDFAIDEDGEPVLIEVNLALGGTANIQACSGPLFGNMTSKVCREVFGIMRG